VTAEDCDSKQLMSVMMAFNDQTLRFLSYLILASFDPSHLTDTAFMKSCNEVKEFAEINNDHAQFKPASARHTCRSKRDYDCYFPLMPAHGCDCTVR
jgi:hypothetical protein